jgi:hypothetical protein
MPGTMRIDTCGKGAAMRYPSIPSGPIVAPS